MKIILRKDVEKLGKEGQVIEVKDGYARNFLLPGEWAYPAIEGNIKLLETEKRRKREAKEKETENLRTLAGRISKISCTIAARVGEKEKLFGSVTKEEIIAVLYKEHGIKLEKESILLPEPIKKLGVYKIPLNLTSEIKGDLKLWVVKEA